MGSSRGGQREEDEATIHGQWRGVAWNQNVLGVEWKKAPPI